MRLCSYIFWDNLFRFLKTLDPDVPLYMGSSTPGRRDNVHYGTTFANGGPGYVLSRAAVKHLLHRETDQAGRFIGPSFTEKWRYLVNDDEPCGDNILGYILWLSGIEMQALYPMFTQHVFHTVPFDSMRWCSPIFTFHKPSPEQMRGLARWEYGTRNNSVCPLLHGTLVLEQLLTSCSTLRGTLTYGTFTNPDPSHCGTTGETTMCFAAKPPLPTSSLPKTARPTAVLCPNVSSGRGEAARLGNASSARASFTMVRRALTPRQDGCQIASPNGWTTTSAKIPSGTALAAQGCISRDKTSTEIFRNDFLLQRSFDTTLQLDHACPPRARRCAPCARARREPPA